MRPIRDNRNIYIIWKRHEGGGLRSLISFGVETAAYLLRVRSHSRDYIREIIRGGYLASINEKRYPGIRMYLPDFRIDLIQKLIVRNQEFFEDAELNMLKEKWIPEGAVICDCGAHIGNHTVYFGCVCKAEHVYSFEPVEHLFRILKRNIELNGLTDTVSAFNVGLGGTESTARVSSYDRSNTGMARITASKKGAIRIERLDDMIPAGIHVDFIKIDVEGGEYSLLEGAARILTESRPVIFIEVLPENIVKVFGLLNEYGYNKTGEFGNDNYLFTA